MPTDFVFLPNDICWRDCFGSPLSAKFALLAWRAPAAFPLATFSQTLGKAEADSEEMATQVSESLTSFQHHTKGLDGTPRLRKVRQ